MIDIIKAAQNGDTVAMDKAVQENMGLVHMAARRFVGRGTDYDDLAQIASMGLIKAIRHFDTEKGLAFSTYAVPAIVGELKRYFRDTGSVKVSRKLKETAVKCNYAKNELEKKLLREPTVSEIASYCGIELEDAVEAINATMPVISLDEKYDTKDDSVNLSDFVGVDNTEALLEQITLTEAINSLLPREKKVILQRYFRCETQCRTAEKLGISQVQVSRIERGAIEKLKLLLK